MINPLMKSMVMLVVTEGCEACAIAHNLTESAIKLSNVDIDYQVVDVVQAPPSLLKEAQVKDFPTTILIKDNVIIDSYSGTKPISFIEKKLKLLI